MSFLPHSRCSVIELPQESCARVFVYNKQDILLCDSTIEGVPGPAELEPLSELIRDAECLNFGQWGNMQCLGLRLPASFQLPASSDLSRINLRQAYAVLPESVFAAACHGFHLLQWDRKSTFCGYCGHRTRWSMVEQAKTCPSCNQVFFPALSPAVIIRITHGRKILLASNARFRTGFFSVLAGYVNPGESLEEAARREIMEEVSLPVRNLQYFGSQPWALSQALMVGFTAELDTSKSDGRITIDEVELMDADWYEPENLPVYPEPPSIANALIEDYLRQYRI